MNPFRRSKAAPEVTLTSDSYRRWLRAQRPPLQWFLRQTTVEQETMAMLGDDYSKDIALAIGFAVADPVAAQAGMGIEKGDETSEEVLATRIANGLIGKIIRGVPAKPATAATFEAPATTFGGFGERRQPKEYAKTTNAPATFMGANPTGDTEEVVHE